MGVSKVVYGANTLIDLTGDTITAADLMQGVTAHGADGEAITGSYVPSTETETLLWTNPNPNSNYSNGEISSAATLTAYDKIRIYYKLQTSSANTLSSMFHLDISMAEWNLMIDGASHMRIFLGCTNGSNQALARTLRQTAAGALFIGNCRQYNSTTERAGWCIPYQVYGVR